ncbi:MAG: hypothetical protein KCHDKBKB_01779 [Elusimicrobia bacterium]|nr:hypothetical protein [Elusimicrobiota bacterium]
MGVNITSADVAEMVVTMLSFVFHKTTGAQVPIDGGDERIISRESFLRVSVEQTCRQ